MRNQALEFATQIIRTDNQYSRLLPIQILVSDDVALRQKLEIQRTYASKLAELVFCKLLQNKNKVFSMDSMFEIYEGQQNTDSFDFITKKNKTVDIKAGFRAIHKRLLVNMDQFKNIPKDYYVGIKLNGRDTDSKSKLIDIHSITCGTVYGYSSYTDLKKIEEYNFGEGFAKHQKYEDLTGIDFLVDEF